MHKDVQYETTIPKITRLRNSQFLENVSRTVENIGTFFVENAKTRRIHRRVTLKYSIQAMLAFQLSHLQSSETPAPLPWYFFHSRKDHARIHI